MATGETTTNYGGWQTAINVDSETRQEENTKVTVTQQPFVIEVPTPESWLDKFQEVTFHRTGCMSFDFEARSVTDPGVSVIRFKRRRFGCTNSYDLVDGISGEHVATLDAEVMACCAIRGCVRRRIEAPPGHYLGWSRVRQSYWMNNVSYYKAVIPGAQGNNLIFLRQYMSSCFLGDISDTSGREIGTLNGHPMCSCFTQPMRLSFLPHTTPFDKIFLLDYAVSYMERSCSDPIQWIAFTITMVMTIAILVILIVVSYSGALE